MEHVQTIGGRFGRGLCGTLVLALCAAAAPAQILNIHADALTTYQPTTATGIQDIRVLKDGLQQGVNLDGTPRSYAPLGWAINGNPFESAAGVRKLGDVMLATGTYAPTAIDMALPATGFSMVFGRTYNGRQETVTAGTHRDSDGVQGKNWQQTGLPEVQFFAGATDDLDVVYVVYGADRYLAFKRTGTGESTFKGVNGAGGGILFAANASGEPETYTYYDQQGLVTTFLGFDGDAGAAAGQFWKMADAAGNTAFVGSATLGSGTATTGYSSGRATTIYDSSDRRYTLTYTSVDSVTRLTQILAETKTGGTWLSSPTGVTTVGQVDYDYYKSADAVGVQAFGDNGNLKLVTVTTPLTDSGVNLVRNTYYRYWKGTYNSVTNPGYPNTIQYVVEAEGYREADWAGDSTFDNDPLTMTESSLKPYAALYLEYDSSYRVSKMWMNGQCGCGGGSANGVHTLTYGASGYTNTSGYDTAWATRTVIHAPDNYHSVYFDEDGQVVLDVVTDGDPAAGSPPPRWVTQTVRDSAGLISEIRTPAANTAYTHSTGAVTSSTSVGLVTVYGRQSSGFVTGYIYKIGHKQGTSGTAYWDRFQYMQGDGSGGTAVSVTIGGTLTLYRPVIGWSLDMSSESSSEVYPAIGADDGMEQTTDAYSGKLAVETVVNQDLPVSTGSNGSGSANTAQVALRDDRTTAFVRSKDARIDYRAYTNGQVTTSIMDADTTSLSPPSGFSSSGTPKDLVTTYTYDAQGRTVSVVAPKWQGSGNAEHSRTYYSKLADGRMVTVSIPWVETVSSTVTFHGPARYTVSNLAGKAELSGTIALTSSGITTALTSWIDETDSDPITALDVGTLTMVSTSVYAQAGMQLSASRMYFDVPGSGAGTLGTNYDERTYGYDDEGRTVRVVDATGTITRTDYDAKGRAVASWLGTDDTGSVASTLSGTSNMVKISATEYDGGSAGGNSYVTARTAYIEGSTTGQRVTSFTNDYRGRTVIVDNPAGPDSLSLYNNLGQVLAMGTYSTASGLTVSSDPTSVTTNRVALSETAYDELHRAYKTTRHEINQSTGASTSSLVTSLMWYDAMGRVIKTRGEQLSKTIYDRLGRATNRFTLAKVDEADTSYADADDVSGDTVLEEHQTYYQDTTGLALMSVQIARHPGDTSTTGALDADSDLSLVDYTTSGGKILGRAQISSSFYDSLNRLTATAMVGTNGGSNFDRDSSASTTRSASNLVTSYAYNDDGTMQDVTDPKALVTRTLYDQAGRKIATIANYVNGTPSGPSGADDVYTRWEYSQGLMATMWVDLDGDNTKDSDDQVTSYIYGTLAGTPTASTISTGNLLRAVKYPDTTNSGTTAANINSDSSDVVSYAYNARGQQTLVKDQAGNIIETSYDTAGRQTSRAVTTLISGFDGSVKRIETAYDGRGMMDTVTQYNAATSGSVTDQVSYTYDGWGNVTDFNQDVDSLIGSSGRAAFGVSYTYAAATPTGGRATIRRSSITLPGSVTVTNGFGSSGSIEDTSSRVAKITQGGVDVASYAYMGAGQVVTTTLGTSTALTSTVFSSGSTYPYLDDFNRIKSSRWTKVADIYRVDLSYDENSNLTLAQDYVLTGTSAGHLFDASYTMDDLNRLTQAKEGHWGGSSITAARRDELWPGLSQTGNWLERKLDLDGNGTFSGTGEMDDSGTFNTANEWLTRDLDSTPGTTTDNFSLVHDAVGNMTDDGKDYKYVYDAFGRLVTVKDQTAATVAEYRYNGLGYRISWHYDADADKDVDGSDPTYYFCYDDRWRVVATFRGSDSDPKERFTFHNAGANGYGGSSYIDLVVLRDRDANTAWTSTSDGTLEERNYYAQNWRADVSVITGTDANPIEWIKYSAYGEASSFALADYDMDGDIDSADQTAWFAAVGGGNGNTDLDFDGDLATSADDDVFFASYGAASTGGRGALSRGLTANRIGYAGYHWDQAANAYHVRHRMYRPDLGQWMQRVNTRRKSNNHLYSYELAYLSINYSNQTFCSPLYSSNSLVTGWQGLTLNDVGVALSDAAAADGPKMCRGEINNWTRNKCFIRKDDAAAACGDGDLSDCETQAREEGRSCCASATANNWRQQSSACIAKARAKLHSCEVPGYTEPSNPSDPGPPSDPNRPGQQWHLDWYCYRYRCGCAGSNENFTGEQNCMNLARCMTTVNDHTVHYLQCVRACCGAASRAIDPGCLESCRGSIAAQ